MEGNWRRNYLRYKSFFLNMLSQYGERNSWKTYLEILLSLGTISVFSIFALKPTVLTIAELIKQIDEKRSTIQKMDNKIQNLSKAQIIYDGERGNINLLEQTAVPKTVNPEVFARQIEGLSVKHNVEILTINLGEGLIRKSPNSSKLIFDNIDDKNTNPTTGGHTEVDFSVSMKSNIEAYQLLNTLLTDFANLRQPPKIERVDFKKEITKEQETTELTLTIKGNLEYLQ